MGLKMFNTALRLSPLMLAAAGLCMVAACASVEGVSTSIVTAETQHDMAPAIAAPAVSAPVRMALGQTADAPQGFLEFCLRDPSQCSTASTSDDVQVAEIRSQASALYWGRVFGIDASQPGAVDAPPAGSDISAVSAEDMTRPAVEVAASDDLSTSATDAGRDVVARVKLALATARRDADTPVVTLGKAQWAAVRRINHRINRDIRRGTDVRFQSRADYWQIPASSGARGDCEDYVLAKRAALIAADIPASALSIAVVDTRWGESHAVLLISTDTGEFVLDNLTPWISRWDQVDYVWRERQAPGKIFDWVRAEV